MRHLLDGYRAFRRESWPVHKARFEALARQGQKPRAMVVACADSRVSPTLVFNAAPGELFTVRNVAAIVPPYAPGHPTQGTSAALEFGVRVLEVPLVIVLGHAMCGGVHALLNGAPEGAGDFIPAWLGIAREARRRTLECSAVEERQSQGEHEVVKLSLGNLAAYPWVAERLADGRLTLEGAIFDIRSGTMEVLGADGAFRPA